MSMTVKRLLLILILLCSTAANAEKPMGGVQYGISIPVAAVLGFGLGHTVQLRWLSDGWKYTLIDFAGLMGCIGDCTYGGAVLIVSRVAQIIDVSVFSPPVRGWAERAIPQPYLQAKDMTEMRQGKYSYLLSWNLADL